MKYLIEEEQYSFCFLYLSFGAVGVHRKVADSFKLEFVQNFCTLD